jgi:hypothetical protein
MPPRMCGEPSPQAAPAPFRLCGCCQHAWATWHEFVLDPDLRLLGLQVVPGAADANVLVFDHCCGSSISVLVRRVRHLLPDVDDTALPPVEVGLDTCRRHCRDLEAFLACERACPKARDRRIVQAIVRLRQGAT